MGMGDRRGRGNRLYPTQRRRREELMGLWRGARCGVVYYYRIHHSSFIMPVDGGFVRVFRYKGE